MDDYETNKKGENKMAYTDLLKEWTKEQSTVAKSDSKFFKPADGKNRIRLIPGQYEGNLPFISFYQHYINGKFYSTKNENNPLTKEGWRLHNEYKTIDPDKAKEARRKYLPSKMVAVRVLVEGQIKVWITTQTRMVEIIGFIEEYGDLFDLDNGRDIILTKTGSGITTKYTIVPAPNTSKVEVLLSAIDLNTFITFTSDEELERLV